jgi:antitoxin CptB
VCVSAADIGSICFYMLPVMNETDPRRRRVLFRATHRGTQETDRLVGGYVAPRLHSFTETELDAIEAMMDLPDVDLADWLMGRVPIPPGEHAALLRAMFQAIHASSAA